MSFGELSKIPCQAKHSKDGGCYVCGGAGYVLKMYACDSCGHAFWDRPNNGITMYDGKQMRAFDGTTLTFHIHGSTCQFCEPSKGDE